METKIAVKDGQYKELLRQELATGVSVKEQIDRALQEFIRAESSKRVS